MKTYATTIELLKAVKAKECPPYPLIDLYKIMVDDQNIEEIILDDLDELFQREEKSIDYWFGGSVNICETEEDLKQVQGCDFEWAEAHNETWPNVTDLPMSWDVCAYCGDNSDNGWALFVLCTNNAGGPSFYIPQHLWKAARLTEHLAKHKEHWGEE